MTKEDILKEFSLFSLQTGGIGSWINEKTDPSNLRSIGQDR